MFEVNRINSLNRPNTIEYLGDGTYYYNYDILPCEMYIEDLIEYGWSFIQVRCSGKADYKDCIKHLIREYVSQDEEFDLINSVNNSMINNTEDESFNKYKEYLNLLKEIKTNVKKDFNI